MTWNKATHQARPASAARFGEYRFGNEFKFIPQDLAGHYQNGKKWLSPGFVVHGGMWKNLSDLPVQGWKFHISAPFDMYTARAIAKDVLPTLIQLDAWHKLPLDKARLQQLYSSPTQQGKFITIYTKGPFHARAIVSELRKVMPRYNVHNSSLAPNEKRVIGLSTVTCRFGAFSGHTIFDLHGNKHTDDRNNPPAWAWHQCPVAVAH